MKVLNNKKNYNQKFYYSIGIPAFNAQNNINNLIDSLLIQKENKYLLNKIFVHSDASTDNTVSAIQKYQNEKIFIIDSSKRKGFAEAVKLLLKLNDSEVMILLNDDIIIKDPLFIEKTLNSFYKDLNVGLVCSNPQPMNPTNFLEEAVISGFRAYEKIKLEIKNGDTVLTCDGKTMALSKAFIKSLQFPEKSDEMGNVDGYIYFSCIKNGFNYKFAKDAIVYFKCPSTVKDFTNWTIRNNITRDIFKKKFGEALISEYHVSTVKFTYYRFIEFLRNPLGSAVLYILSTYCSVKASLNNKQFNSKWDLGSTTKELQQV